MSSASNTAALTDGSVERRFAQLWLPMIGGVLSVKLIGLSDAYFIGQLGKTELAAVSFTFPVVMVLITLAIGLSSGASSVLSRAIGEADQDARARHIATGAMVIAAGLAVMLGLTGFLSIRPLLALMGAAGEVLSEATAYMRIWFAGAVVMFVPVVANGLLRAEGDGLTPALLMAGVAVINIAINPLFIYGFGPVPGLGVQGAATATITARALGGAAAVIILLRRDLLRLSAQAARAGLGHWREISRIGGPAAFSTSFNPFAVALATSAVATLGTAEVAAFGVATKIQSLAVVPLLALSAAAAPFAGQNSGSGETGRTREGLKFCLMISLGWAVLTAIALGFGGGWLAAQFTDAPDAQAAVRLYLWIVPISYAGYGAVIALTAALNGIGRPVEAMAISGGRAIGLLAPGVWIGALTGGFIGVAIAMVIANLASGLAAAGAVLKHSFEATGSGGQGAGSEDAE